MNRNRISQALLVALLGSAALVGCKKKEEAVVTPPPAPMETTPAPAPMAATASVTSVDLGTVAGADMKIANPSTTFAPKDTIIAAVNTSTSDAAATVPGKLGAKWSYQDGQVVNDETKDINFTGTGTTDFQINKPDGFPAGKYKVEVSLDGNVVQSKDFDVK